MRNAFPSGLSGPFVCLLAGSALALVAGCGAQGKSTSGGAAPQPPAAVVALSEAGGVVVTWSPVAGASNYVVHRGVGEGAPLVFLNLTPVTAYVDTAVQSGVTYVYAVAASNASGLGSFSTRVSATASTVTTLTVPPLPPTSLTSAAGSGAVTLNWTASLGATDYVVLRATTTGGPYTQAGTTAQTAYTDLYLTNGQPYCYVVRAADAAGTSGNSNESCATPAAGSGGGSGAWWQ